MHSSLLAFSGVLTVLLLLSSPSSAQISIPLPQTIDGVLVTPGPAITGIKSSSDVSSSIIDNILSSGGHFFKKRSQSSPSGTIPICNSPNVKTGLSSDVQILINYIGGLPNSTQCAIQNAQYQSDCGNYVCANMIAAGSARADICLTADSTVGAASLSFATTQCNTVVKSYIDTINKKCINAQTTRVEGHEFFNSTDFLSNNAQGTNYHTSSDVAVIVYGTGN